MAESPRPLLTETLRGRDNSFDLIRLAACVIIVVFHAFPLTGTFESSNSVMDITFGHIGLLSLFGISGFLVTASWYSAPRLWPYFVKRGLRVFPGLIVSLIVTALVIGPLVTTQSLGAYLTNLETYTYVLKGSFLVTFNTELPGVFGSNPFPDVVNGSLWTVPVEWLCYSAVAAAALIRALHRPWILAAILGGLLVAMSVGATTINPNLPADAQDRSLLLVLLPCGSFLAGVLMFVLRDHIRRYEWAPLVALAVLVAPIPAGLHMGLEMLAIPYAAIHIGLTPPGKAAVLVRPGDVSYGVYIYSFPVQQAVVHWIPGIGPLGMIAIALPASWLLGLVSWRLLEHRALELKQRLAETRGLAQR